MSRYTVLAAALGVITAATAACSSGSGDTGGGATPTAPSTTTTATATTTTTATATTTTATTTDGGQGIASGEPNPATSSRSSNACLESQLRASVDSRRIPGNGTAGGNGRLRHGVLVDFLNKSGSTCTLYGYPGAAIVGSDGKQVEQAERVRSGALVGTTPLDTVTLKPGVSAQALLEGVDTREKGAAQAGCDGARYPRILVTPPDTDTPVPFTVGWPQCYSFTVHPVQQLS